MFCFLRLECRLKSYHVLCFTFLRLPLLFLVVKLSVYFHTKWLLGSVFRNSDACFRPNATNHMCCTLHICVVICQGLLYCPFTIVCDFCRDHSMSLNNHKSEPLPLGKLNTKASRSWQSKVRQKCLGQRQQWPGKDVWHLLRFGFSWN